MVVLSHSHPRFALGRVVATRGALRTLATRGRKPDEFLSRHVSGDWGDVSAADAQSNEESLTTGARLVSCYRISGGVSIWIITEADRSATTILLPDEY